VDEFEDVIRVSEANLAEAWPQQGSLCIECGSGNGLWVADQATKRPLEHWVAIEKKGQRVRKIARKKRNQQLHNLSIVWGKVEDTLPFWPTAAVKEVHILFPDPWPKGRHAENRLITPEFVQALSEKVQTEGEVHIVTDDEDYRDRIEHAFEGSAFQFTYDSAYQVGWEGVSTFCELWKKLGKSIYSFSYKRDSRG